MFGSQLTLVNSVELCLMSGSTDGVLLRRVSVGAVLTELNESKTTDMMNTLVVKLIWACRHLTNSYLRVFTELTPLINRSFRLNKQ